MLRLLSQTHWCVARRRLLIAGDGRRVNKIRICLLVSTEYTNVTDRRTPRDGIITPCNVARSDIDFARWLHPQCGMWLWNQSWQWIHQVAAPCNQCNVTRNSGIMALNSPGDCTLHCGMWLWEHDSEFTKWHHPAMWYVALGWHAVEFSRTSTILEFYIWFRFRPYHRSRHVILHQSAKFYPNRTTLGSEVMSIFKMADLSHLWF